MSAPRPPRHHWMPDALPILFGPAPEARAPWPDLLPQLERVRAVTTEVAAWASTREVGLVESTSGRVGVGQEHANGSASDQSDIDATIVVDHRAPLRVVLMGRTMAGKSSLLAALTGEHRDRIGDGRQRFSRDVFDGTLADVNDIEVIDTPGVGAYGGADDTAIALSAALRGDVILWVNSSDSIQQESADALKWLGALGKPIIVAINCRQELKGVGRINLLRYPQKVFGDKEGLVGEITRHLASTGVRPVEVVHVHALAASAQRADGSPDAELRAASRLEELLSLLIRERDAHRESRQLLRVVDGERQRVEDLGLALMARADVLRAEADQMRAVASDRSDRLLRLVRVSEEAMCADVEVLVGCQREWHLTVSDFGKTLPTAWDTSMADLTGQLDRALRRRGQTLTEELREADEAVEAEWASAAVAGLTGLSGFGSVWPNRLTRAGISAAAGLASAVLVSNPPGIAVAVGLVAVPWVAGRLKNFTTQMFWGKGEVLRRRREELSQKVGPLLDEVSARSIEAIGQAMEGVREQIAQGVLDSADRAGERDRLAEECLERATSLRALRDEVDRETTVALLRLDDRERLAGSLRRATRVPGVCIVAEFDETGHAEAWLFPPDVGEALTSGPLPLPSAESARALTYALGLVEAPITLERSDSDGCTLLLGADVPEPITRTWADALTEHLTHHIQFATIERTATP